MNSRPSKQLVASTAAGGGAGALIEFTAAALGHPLPPGAGALLAAGLTAATHWIQKRGRAPAPQPPEIP